MHIQTSKSFFASCGVVHTVSRAHLSQCIAEYTVSKCIFNIHFYCQGDVAPEYRYTRKNSSENRWKIYEAIPCSRVLFHLFSHRPEWRRKNEYLSFLRCSVVATGACILQSWQYSNTAFASESLPRYTREAPTMKKKQSREGWIEEGEYAEKE